MTEPAYCRPDAYAAFAERLADIESAEGLFRAAFTISLHECPEASLSEAETIVENLADSVRKRVHSDSTEALLAHLHDVLFDVFGLRGNREDYYNPANSYVLEVLRSKQGIPITLTLIYKRVAAQVGLQVYGVNAPGHFLAEVELSHPSGVRSMYVDPFFGGGVLDRQEVTLRITEAVGQPVADEAAIFSRATSRMWLARMLNNLQASFASLGNERNVCAMQELRELL